MKADLAALTIFHYFCSYLFIKDHLKDVSEDMHAVRDQDGLSKSKVQGKIFTSF